MISLTTNINQVVGAAYNPKKASVVTHGGRECDPIRFHVRFITLGWRERKVVQFRTHRWRDRNVIQTLTHGWRGRKLIQIITHR